MKAIARTAAFAACIVTASFCAGQMTPDQKVADFTELAANFAKNYGPAAWKRESLHVDVLNIGDWLKRAANTPDDISFYSLCVDYVASLKDAHSGFYVPSNFEATTLFRADLYDGRLVVDELSPLLEGADSFPVAPGDEILAVDGVAAADLIAEYSRYAPTGNPSATRRIAAAYLFDRLQQLIPDAPSTPDRLDVTLQHADGRVETVKVDWVKTGEPLTAIGPVISPFSAAPAGRSTKTLTDAPEYMTALRRLQNMRLPSRRFVRGFGSTEPPFYLPQSFQRRSNDFFYTGTYTSDGVRIGFIRIPTFSGGDPSEFRDEIAYMKDNTDALVLDITRNPGGSACFALDLLKLVIPHSFQAVGLEIRATRGWVLDFEWALQTAIASGASSSVIATYRNLLDVVQKAYLTPSGRTPALPVCDSTLDTEPATDANGALLAYDKPIVLVTDEFSASAADMFAATFQDAVRGPVFGARTMGAGGNVEYFPAVTTYSDGDATITESLMVRSVPQLTADYGETAYVENVGVSPDIPATLMTRENLENGGYPFVDAFTKATVDAVKAAHDGATNAAREVAR